jgi:hypothetical protein
LPVLGGAGLKITPLERRREVRVRWLGRPRQAAVAYAASPTRLLPEEKVLHDRHGSISPNPERLN